MRQIRTDMALESYQAFGQGNIAGAQLHQWECGGIQVTEVTVDTEQAARLLGKPIGSYITLEASGLRGGDPDLRIALANILGEEISRMLTTLGIESSEDSAAPVLVVGLGNRAVTPDSLGPVTADRTLVTRHVLREMPDRADHRIRSVCAIAPGVLGVTGIETIEMIESLSNALHPRAVICVDSLAARAASRVGCAVQLTDAGIQPGSGVGNYRRPLTRASLGCEVIAIGIPTVVYAATLTRDIMREMDPDADADAREADYIRLEQEIMDSSLGEMIVTPREIDALVDQSAQIIAAGINKALQPELSDEEIAAMMC